MFSKEWNCSLFSFNINSTNKKNLNTFILASIFDKKELDFSEFSQTSIKEWEEVIAKDLKGEDYKKKFLWQDQGFSVLPFYRKENLTDFKNDPIPLFSKSEWEICQIIEADSISVANSKALFALENGASGIYFDLSLDLIPSYTQFKALYDNILIEIIGIHFSAQLSNPTMRTWFWELVAERGLDINSIQVRFETDSLSLSAQSGKLLSYSEYESIIKNLSQHHGKSIQIDSISYAEAGATLSQQIAFSIASLNEALHIASKNNTLEELSNSFYFAVSVSSLYFPEIAKLRALRILGTQLIREYGLKDFSSDSINIHAETSKANKASWDSYNNMLRNSLEAMIAILGGASSLCVRNFDGNFKSQTPFSDRNARNTQLVLQEEAYLNQISDASAGSYYIEALTDSLASSAWELFKEIEEKGGFYEALKSGEIQNMILESKKSFMDEYKNGEKILVGVNKYPPKNPESFNMKEKDLSFFKPENHTEIQKINPVYFSLHFENGGSK